MRTTLDLPDPLLRELKTRAARNGQSLKSLINDLIQRAMTLPAIPPEQQTGFPVLMRLQGPPQPVQAQSNAQFAEHTLQEEVEKLRRIGFIQ
jgi:plasmid stability protein